MKSTGVVRRVDELGRIVIPIELRRTLDIAEKDALEIYVDGEQIILKKYEPACIFCGDARDVINYKGKNICKKCLEEISNNIERFPQNLSFRKTSIPRGLFLFKYLWNAYISLP